MLPRVPLDQIVSLLGAVLILAAFVASTLERLDPRSRLYLWLNFVGAAGLTYTAVVGRQYGFVLLEGTWSAVAGVTLLRGRPRTPA
ncbi:MAG: hypothetical protein K1X88_25865 [Nannocystaceae bacterium]|nr:hypothetical protein [Nannocystaceae bacterium]